MRVIHGQIFCINEVKGLFCYDVYYDFFLNVVSSAVLVEVLERISSDDVIHIRSSTQKFS